MELSHIAEPLRSLAVPIESLSFDPANARKHGEKNLDAIKASLHRWGQRLPLVVQREGMVVRAGNGRLAAAKSLGWSHVAALIVDEPSVEATAFAIADNRSAELAEWDDESLAALLQSLPDDAKVSAGFDDKDLKELLNRLSPEIVEDEAPEPLPDPVSKTGDLWLMGGHRLLCGDSTKAEDVEKCLGGAKPFLMVTDPPYGVEYDPDWRNEAADKGLIAHAARRVGVVANDDRADWKAAYNAFPGHVAYVWHASASAVQFAQDLMACGFDIRNQIIWKKPRFAISRGHYHWQHEPCWYAVRRGWTSKWIGDRSSTTVWDIGLDKNVDGGHSTQKPVECMARPIRNHDAAEVYEPFSGSGTTIVACEQLGRKCYAIEIEPRYVDVAVRRWEKLTGKEATHAESGRTWKQTAAERGVEFHNE